MSLGGVKPDWYLHRDNYKLVLCLYISHEKKSQPFYDFEGILLLVDRLAGLHDALHAAGNDGRHRGLHIRRTHNELPEATCALLVQLLQPIEDGGQQHAKVLLLQIVRLLQLVGILVLGIVRLLDLGRHHVLVALHLGPAEIEVHVRPLVAVHRLFRVAVGLLVVPLGPVQRGELCGEVLLQVGTIAKAFLQVHMDARD